MVRLHTELFIDAPPERVWSVLTDFGGYPAWNPLLLEARGEAREGARRLVWKGGVPGLLHGEHYFELTPEGSGTRFVQGEHFTGVLSLLLPAGLRKKLERGYAGMNEALAQRVRSS